MSINMAKIAAVIPCVAVAVMTLCLSPAIAADALSNTEKLNQSLAKWQEAKAQCRGNYSYTVRFQSWAGFGNETVIVVRDNKVVERQYSEFSHRPAPIDPNAKATAKPPGEHWIERGENLGKNKKGAAVKTLDELYEEAQKVLKAKLTPAQRLYVNFDKQGLLKDCFYIDTRIADDAPRTGISLSSVKLESAEKNDAKK